MALSLGDIEETLFQALAAIAPAAAAGTPGVPAGPVQTAANGASVRYIGRWVGEPARNTPVTDYFRAAIFKEVGDRTPAILLGFEGESPATIRNPVATLAGAQESVGASVFSVLCVVNDTRATRLLLRGTPAGSSPTMGVYDLLALAEAAVVDLIIPGLYRGQRVTFVASRPLIIAPGELYVLQLRVQALRVLHSTTVTAPTNLLQLSANVNAYPLGLLGDFADNPLSSVLSFPGGAPPPMDYPPLRGLLARFDAAAVNGVDRDGQPLPLPNDGQPVAEWKDRHSGRWTLAQAEADLQPRMDAGAYLDNPAVLFDGTRSLSATVDWLPVGAEERTVVVVGGGLTIDPLLEPTLLSWGTDSALQLFRAAVSVGVTDGFAADTGGTGTVQATGGFPMITPFWWVRLTYTGTAVTVVAKNGAATASATLALALATEGTLLTLGTALVGKLAEVLIYRCALDTDEATALDAYVSARYLGA